VQGEMICVSNLRLTLDLEQKIVAAQEKDIDFQDFKRKMLSKKETDFRQGKNGMLYFCDWICVLNEENLRKQILGEIHKSRYVIHLGEVKMYKDLKKVY
jgi:hypothetical protein